MRLPARIPLAAMVVAVALALAGCAPHGVEASVQAEEVLTEAGVPVDGVYVNVEPVAGGVDTPEGDHIIQIEVTYDDKGPAAHAGIADTAARTLWTRSIAHIDAIVVQGPEDHPDASSSRFTAEELTQRYGQRPAGLVEIDATTLAEEDAEQTGGLFALAAVWTILPLLLLGGFLLLVALIVVVVLLARRRGRRPPPGHGPWQPQAPHI